MTGELRLRRRIERLARIAVVLAGVAALGVGCAESSLDVGVRPENEAGVTPSFTPDPDAGDGSLPDTPRLLCLGTECPFPYATCPSSDGVAPVYKCQHDLLRDNDNCGSCGTKCQVYDVLAMRSSCVSGECVAECIDKSLGDCNARLEDGCETSLLDDPNNCGACGNACAPGVPCRLGTCGCTSGLTECSDVCVDLQSTNAHCGACGNRCTPPDAAAPPPNSEYGCVGGKCGELRCTGDHHTRWADCNGDIMEPDSDGCEIDIGPDGQDAENCGGCGIKCAPGQICRAINDVAQCICKPNETMCGTPEWPFCADIRTDTENCGACGYVCPRKLNATLAEDPHQIVSCTKGMCAYDCAPGWADCNDNLLDGCETNLMVHGGNCGACGERCNSAAGQPCVQGVCLEVDCDAGGPPR